MRDLAWIGVGVAALTLGCASAPPAASAGEKTVPGAQFLLGSEWELVDLGGAPVLEEHRPTLGFVDPGRVSGNASCNRYGAGAEVGDGTLRVGQVATTRMACSPEIDAQEKAFLVALQNARTLELAGGELVVHTESLEKPLRFRRVR